MQDSVKCFAHIQVATCFSWPHRVALLSHLGVGAKLNIAEDLFGSILVLDSLHVSCFLSCCSRLSHVDLVMEDP